MRAGDLQDLAAGKQRAEAFARRLFGEISADKKWNGSLRVQTA